MKELKSMVEFVKDTGKTSIEDRSEWDTWKMLYDYANFLSQKLELWMFVPCDENGNVLEYKEPYEDGTNIQYQQAKDRVLFEGFEVEIDKHERIFLNNEKSQTVFIGLGWTFENENIESLIEYKPTLTATALKQIGV